MQIYNTLTQAKENFVPLEPGRVKIYLCGPTVYNLLHIGNFRGPIFFNLVRHFFEHEGFKVTFVYNYTDVDDKIIKAAAEEKTTALELADKYIAEFEKDFKTIGLRPADVNPRVTHHILDIVSMIEKMIEHRAAYVVDGEVFCSIKAIKDYGKLSHKNIDELIAGSRVEIGEKKQNPLDFSLWKPAKAGEPFWPSPWGNGRPGWHIECSAMSKKYLGDSFDIHGGGIDLIFPHHENEIAQSESANEKPFAKYWMHNNFIIMGKEKMSKSLGNVFNARQFLEVYNGEILKFLMLSAHYRSPCDFGANIIGHATHGLARIYSSLAQAEGWIEKGKKENLQADPQGPTLDDQNFGSVLNQLWSKVEAALRDDFNTPQVMAELFIVVRAFNALLKPGLKLSQPLLNSCQKLKDAIRGVGSLMSLFQMPPQAFLIELDDMLLKEKSLERSQIQKMVDERIAARSAKDFKKSDELRNQLQNLGIEIKDTPDGTYWEVKK